MCLLDFGYSIFDRIFDLLLSEWHFVTHDYFSKTACMIERNS
jgi:hypothetical protein